MQCDAMKDNTALHNLGQRNAFRVPTISITNEKDVNKII